MEKEENVYGEIPKRKSLQRQRRASGIKKRTRKRLRRLWENLRTWTPF